MQFVQRMLYSYSPNVNRIASRSRQRRFKIVNAMISDIIKSEGACRILDIGGSDCYWALNDEFLRSNHENIHITIINNDSFQSSHKSFGMFTYKSGDALNPKDYEGDFNMTHSNSVIEHVGKWKNIRIMADNISRNKTPYYIQTPNYWFPMEPHFRAIGFHWLSSTARARQLLKRQRGSRSARTLDEAMEQVEAINLLTHFQMRDLFPEAVILRESFGPLTKSFMAVRHRSPLNT